MPRLDQTSAANGFPRRIAWSLGIDRIRLPAAILVALLQRAPAVRAVADIANHVLESPAGALIRAAAASVAALGAVDSMAGATAYVLSTGSPGHPSPYTVNTGSQIEGVAFALTSTPPTAAPPQSWTIGGSIPPGLEFGTTGHFITAPGTVNASIPTLVGTPTTPGTYTMTLQAWEFTGGTGLFSSVFTYEVIVESGPTPTPSPTPTPTPTPSPTPTPVSGAAPVFTVQPISVAVPGGTVALAAQASNSPSYQWMLNGLTPVPGATGPILEFANAATASGSYTCVATNSAGSATSNAAAISLTGTADLGRLINISCRAQVGTGGSILIAGFVVGGQGTAGSEPLLVRGSGPALASFGVTGTLPDPELQLFSGSTVLGTNNGWGGSAQIANAAASVGAFAWTNSSSHDSALLEDLQSGPYTAQIQGQSGDTGVALVEVYDATPGRDLHPGFAKARQHFHPRAGGLRRRDPDRGLRDRGLDREDGPHPRLGARARRLRGFRHAAGPPARALFRIRGGGQQQQLGRKRADRGGGRRRRGLRLDQRLEPRLGDPRDAPAGRLHGAGVWAERRHGRRSHRDLRGPLRR